MKKFQKLAVLFSFLLLTACGQKLSGTYVSVSPQGMGHAMDGLAALVFESGDKVIIKTVGAAIEATYAVDGKNLKITANGQTMVLDLKDDGSIGGWPGGLTLKKK